MQDEKSKVVPFERNVSKRQKKEISKEPEMVELKGMIQVGQLDKDRTIEYPQSGGKSRNKTIGEIQTVDLPKIKIKIVATLEEQKSGTWILLIQHNKIDGGHWTETDFKILFRAEAWGSVQGADRED